MTFGASAKQSGQHVPCRSGDSRRPWLDSWSASAWAPRPRRSSLCNQGFLSSTEARDLVASV